MKLINWLIKMLVNYKYKKDRFLTWSWRIDDHTDMYISSFEENDCGESEGFETKTEVFK